MIDFWEIIGHGVTDDSFRNTLYNAFQASAPKGPSPDPNNTFACLFKNPDYDQARALVIKKMGPVSLMALGELFVLTMLHRDSRPILDNVAQIVQGAIPGYTSADPNFYRALGACVVDAAFAAQLIAGQEANFGFNLSPDDRTALLTAVQAQGFLGQAGQFHDLNWSSGCKDMVIQSQGEPYAHALEVKFQGAASQKSVGSQK